MPLKKRHPHSFFHEKLEIITTTTTTTPPHPPATHCLDHCLLTINGINQRLCKWGVIVAMKVWSEQQDTGTLIYGHCNIFPFLSLPLSISAQWAVISWQCMWKYWASIHRISQFVCEKLRCSFIIRFWQTLCREFLYK